MMAVPLHFLRSQALRKEHIELPKREQDGYPCFFPRTVAVLTAHSIRDFLLPQQSREGKHRHKAPRM